MTARNIDFVHHLHITMSRAKEKHGNVRSCWNERVLGAGMAAAFTLLTNRGLRPEREKVLREEVTLQLITSNECMAKQRGET